MKRKRLILTAVLLTCVAAVVVPNWREIWLAVAYERVEVAETPFSKGMDRFVKKHRWLPGTPTFMRDQVCGNCQVAGYSKHRHCLGETFMNPAHGGLVVKHTRVSDVQLIQPWESWRCTCPDPSHEWNR